jgi:hypothetical protein
MLRLLHGALAGDPERRFVGRFLWIQALENMVNRFVGA